jgi:hypothetical protein
MRHVPKPDRFVSNFLKKPSGRGEKLGNKRKKEANHTEGGFEDKGKEKAVEKRKRPSSEEGKQKDEKGKKAKTGE